MHVTMVMLALLGAMLLEPGGLAPGLAYADAPDAILLQSDGNYSGTVAPGAGQWYRFWYPGTPPSGCGAVIWVTTTFSSSKAVDPHHSFEVMFQGGTIDPPSGSLGPGPGMAGRAVHLRPTGMPFTCGTVQEIQPYRFEPPQNFLGSAAADWYLLWVFNDSGVPLHYTGHITPVGTPAPSAVAALSPTPMPLVTPPVSPPGIAASASPSVTPQGESVGLNPGECPPGRSPGFVLGFANLRDQVGDAMGNPVECERANPDNGDTLQQTTTGLAFYRKSTNTPTFTTGPEHWALTPEGTVYWTGNSIDPSPDAQPLDVQVAAEPAPASEPALPPPPEASPNFLIVGQIDSNQFIGAGAIRRLADYQRSQRLGLPTVPPATFGQLGLVAAQVRQTVAGSYRAGPGLERPWQLYLAALDEDIAGAQSEAQGLSNGDQGALAAAVSHFNRCDQLLQQAEQALG